MYVKKIRRKCNVRGCKNVDSYTISLNSELGNSVIICKSCLEKALAAINEAQAPIQIVNGEFICPTCNKGFKSRSGLRKHISSVHGGGGK